MVIKYCFVPSCNNSSKCNPNKIFIRLPANMEIRKKWYQAVFPDSQIDITKTSMLFCCEDHFDLMNDSENWIQYTMIAKKLLMKKDAIPHKNLNFREHENLEESQFDNSAKKRKQERIETFNSYKKINVEDIPAPISSILPSTSSSNLIPPLLPSSSCCELNLALGKMYISEGTQVKPQMRSIGTQVNFIKIKLLKHEKKQETELQNSTSNVKSSDSVEDVILKEQRKHTNFNISIVNVETLK